MQVRNVHSRELPVSAGRLGRLVDGLGGEEDRLWPTERWPTTPFQLEGPLAVGTRGRQGQIRQVVEEHEPGRRLVFRFAPGLGLVGTHRLEVEALDADRSRLTHTLQCRVEPRLLPLYPILIRQHDALVEDLFDRAELALTGRVARPAHWPVSVRIANAPVALAALGAVHAAWALGWRWPRGSDQELAERLFSRAERDRLMELGGGELPPAPATWGVACALLAAAGTVGNAATGTRSLVLRLGTWGVAGVLLARGAIGIASDLHGGVEERYQRLDLAIYSPLCLALGGGAALVARRAASPAQGPR